MNINEDFYCNFVLNNKIKIEKVRETNNVLAFYHTKPNWTLHIVIIPKQHITRLTDLENTNLIKEIFEVVIDIIKEKNLSESNYKIITNGGSFQESQHLHFHLVSGEPKQFFNE
ncbi:TPA: HIT family hydrolase [Candidatus Campbellbacteria bacterium]|jgi:histidine triad (HIT) family protein|nr:MAG: hint-3, Histidine triad nucleotide-binding protein 2, Hit-like protein involved in cell-cycle regulation [Candidatus Campbellbacteria bacterium GW2011_OD1_34_28]KKP75394.1 MAG: histidine triad (HIT) protein [Candidatus Campbellbacteria bacterium GW2011_GWD2_35_24]KKP76045.1 MAG: Histidine triad nucleotide-binding protein 2, Hit-like protein involved in cell-cycle regulation [Candidatus Campbellbacteria bacterium GW2011_GWC2_35_28]KKP77234.1 MAG: histidine triad (HIT) protein [Candidatus 